MTTLDISKIDLGKLSKELRRYERQWVAISERNEIVASGRTYGETVRKVKHPEEVVLFKVPPMDYSLALEQEPAVAPGGTSPSFDARPPSIRGARLSTPSLTPSARHANLSVLIPLPSWREPRRQFSS
jgi:hypothetical protein